MDNIDNEVLKGKEIVDFLDNYVVVDIETTGKFKYDDIIEISALRYKNCELVDFFSELIYSEKISIFSEAYKINHISPDMVKDSPKIEEVLERFVQFLDDDDILVGHNIQSYHINRINMKLLEIGECITNDFVDTLKISKRFDDFDKNSLDYLAEKFGLNKQKHRSYSDCLLCNELYQKLKEKFLKEFDSLESFKNKKISNNSYPYKIISNNELDKNIFFYNKKICITGDLFLIDNECNKKKSITKDELKDYIKAKGGLIRSSVNKLTDYLIVGDLSSKNNTSTKLINSEEYCIDRISFEKFAEIVNLELEKKEK